MLELSRGRPGNMARLMQPENISAHKLSLLKGFHFLFPPTPLPPPPSPLPASSTLSFPSPSILTHFLRIYSYCNQSKAIHTSSSVLKGTMHVTGPKTSSCMSLLSSNTFVITAGRMKYPCMDEGGQDILDCYESPRQKRL